MYQKKNQSKAIKKLFTILTSLFICISTTIAQDDPLLNKAYAKLKETHIDLANYAVPFKENGKWGLKSYNNQILYNTTIDSMYTLTTKSALPVFYFIIKEKGLYKILDCNGNVVLGKMFTKINMGGLFHRREIKACDDNNSYEIEINKENISLKYLSKTFCDSNRIHSVKSNNTDFYFVISAIDNKYGFVVSDTLSNTSLLTIKKVDTVLSKQQIKSQTRSCEIFDSKILYLTIKDKLLYYLIESNKFYDPKEFVMNYPINKDEYLVFKDNSIVFLDKNGDIISTIKYEYDRHLEPYYNKFLIKEIRGEEEWYKVIDLVNHKILDIDLNGTKDYWFTKDFYCFTDKNSVTVVYDNSLNEIYKDTNVLLKRYLPKYGPEILMIFKDGIWKGITKDGKIIGEGFVPGSKYLVVERGAFKLFNFSSFSDNDPDACGVYMGGKLFIIDARQIDVLDSNHYLIKEKNNKCMLVDSNGIFLLKNMQLSVVKFGSNYILEAIDASFKSYQINPKLQKIVSKKIYLSVFNITNRKVESPFTLYQDNTNKDAYGLVDDNDNIIQPNEYKIIMAINKNFIVVDKNYEIGFLDHNGNRLF